MERKHPEALCEQCPLYDKPCAPTQFPLNGNPHRAAVVSRSPGPHEARLGIPFSGPSGDVLDFLLKQNGVKRDEILVTNTVLCAPDAGKVPPEAIKACAPRLRAELEQGNIDLVIAAGSEAVNLLVGRGAIERFRGYRIQRGPKTFVATNNPALVLRDDGTFPNLKRDFRRAFNPLPEPALPIVEVIEDANTARDYLQSIRGCTHIACDVESRGGLTHRARLVSMQFATDGALGVVFGERGGIFDDRDFLERDLKPALENRESRWIWHNGKFDIKILRYGYDIGASVDEDTMLLSYALDERGGVHALEYLLMEEFGWPNYEPESVREFKRDGVVRDYDDLYTYAGRDVAGTYQLFDRYRPRLERGTTERAYYGLLIDGSEAITRIELAGFRFDAGRACDLMENEVGPELKRVELNLRRMLDKPLLKPRSTKQMAHLYYDEWKINHAMRKRPEKERSVDVYALKEIVADRFIAPARVDRKQAIAFSKEMLQYRALDKQASTYIVGMAERTINDPEGKAFTDILLHGTTSGRTSSRGPNLQNITRSKPGLPDIRSLFVASPGRQIVQADYSQAELRTIAVLSQDPELLRVYRNDLDLHSQVAEQFYGVGYTSEQRVDAKIMNFSVAYGIGAATFNERHEIPVKRAQQFIDWWWEYFPAVGVWKSEIVKEMKTGEVTSPFGRKRRFHLLTAENYHACVREAVNFKPQSIAGDFTLASVIKLSNEIDWSKAAIVITVHDSIVADVMENYLDTYTSLCKEVMESRPQEELGWTLPFKVDIGVGDTWATAK